MIYTVTFNPSIDYIVKLDKFVPGMVNRTSNEMINPGGKGINVAIVLKNLGFDSTALGFTAGFTGKEIERLLKERKISSDLIHLSDGNSRINVKIKAESESEINGGGPVITKEAVKVLFDKLSKLKKGDFLVLAGSIPKSMDKTIYSDIMAMLKGTGVNVVVDATKELLLNVLKYNPFLIKPNNHELGDLFGVELHSMDEIEKYARKLKNMGALNVLISMAGDGAMLIDEYDEKHIIKAPHGEVKNSVGAGDSMVAGFIAGYIDSHDYSEALKMGICAGSASAFSEGFGTKDAIYKLKDTLFD